MLKTNKFATISDMGRKEGAQEGYVLLRKITRNGGQNSFYDLCLLKPTRAQRMARERGAIGSTNRAEELFQTVMGAITNSS